MTINGGMTIKFMMHRSLPRFAKLLNLKMFDLKMEKFFKDIVSKTVKVRDEQGIVRPDIIQLMMETRNKDTGPEFDIDEMTAQAFVFFLGFHCIISHVLDDIRNRCQSWYSEQIKRGNI